jgi:hypothetical protein
MFYKSHFTQDFLYVSILAFIFFTLSVAGINWDHLELLNGIASDPDKGSVDEALGYVHSFSDNWYKGHKENPQGYGLILALFFKIIIFFSSLFDLLPSYEISQTTSMWYRVLPLTTVSISTEEARIFYAISARAVSALFVFFTVLLTYIIGRNYFKSRNTGFISALLLLGFFPIILLSQFAKYPAVAIFFFLLSFYSSLVLLEKPTLKNYLLNGAIAGVAISMVYYNGVALILLSFIHVLILFSEKRLTFLNILFDKRYLFAISFCLLFFLIFNPRILAFPLEWLAMIWKRTALLWGSHPRLDPYLNLRYDGPLLLLHYIKNEFGWAYLLCMLFGIGYGVINWKDKNIAPFTFVATI